MINFGKFGDETVSTLLILRQKVLNLNFKPLILAFVSLKYFVVNRLKTRKSTLFKAKFTFKKNYINIFALKLSE
ncbi:Uncharacterised protein [Chryseobacterium nakagawai]|uniref:Uncharacterized protein n=1 Tax=Chryseobacterium nakagawai TaxID=1241982 RepID=A0AAD1DSD7_CHRNA|nr:hypothetical protein [Chryseobacterium nakagawai]AZA91804.1 hypothetical protein EG343_14855 [Chryseobacterium nakagawai]VEH18318.1 Uncharacterised protein [Chryseobacterium nakagawai]